MLKSSLKLNLWLIFHILGAQYLSHKNTHCHSLCDRNRSPLDAIVLVFRDMVLNLSACGWIPSTDSWIYCS